MQTQLRTLRSLVGVRMSQSKMSSRGNSSKASIGKNSEHDHVLAESTADTLLPSTSTKQLAIYIARHAERVDFTFGHRWWVKCMDETGLYNRINLNLPPRLPVRDAGMDTFENDTCLTSMGLYQAFLTGTGFREHNVKITHCYASCALRSVQTAHQILDGADCVKNVKICVEPGLYEWLGWVKSSRPNWMTPKEFINNNLNADDTYVPLMTASQFNWDEDVPEYYVRNSSVTRHTIDKHTGSGGVILLVGHASTLDTCTRMVLNFPARTHADMVHVTYQVPYSAVVKLHPADSHGSVADAASIASKPKNEKHQSHVSWRISEPEFGASIYHDANRPFIASTVLAQSGAPESDAPMQM